MSWSVAAQGAKDQVREEASQRFDAQAAMYAQTNPEEKKDIEAAKGVVLSLLDNLVGFDPDPPYAPDGYEARVSCYGSRSVGFGGSVHVSVEKTPKKG